MKIESKFWDKVGRWCVAVTLPDFDYWSENCWDKDRAKAERKVMDVIKKHITWVRELKKSAEVRNDTMVF